MSARPWIAALLCLGWPLTAHALTLEENWLAVAHAHDRLEEALAESEDRNAPLLLIAHREGDDASLVWTLMCWDDCRFRLAHFAIVRLDVEPESADREAAVTRWGTEILGETPAIHAISPAGERVPDLSRARPEAAELPDVLARIAAAYPEAKDRQLYLNTLKNWNQAREAVAAGEVERGLFLLRLAVEVATDPANDYEFGKDARELQYLLAGDPRGNLEKLAARVAEKDWKRAHDLVRILRISRPSGDSGEEVDAALAALETDPECVRAFQAIEVEAMRPRTDAHLAGVEKDRVPAMAALRERVAPSDVPDDQVRVIFWDRVTARLPSGELVDGFAGGFWLGEDRAVVLVWDSIARAILERSIREFRAEDASDRTLHSLVREFARWNARPVVPVDRVRNADGTWRVRAIDGWDADCGHWSEGAVEVDPATGRVVHAAHVK